MDFLTFKCHNFFQNKNNIKASYSFAPWPLTFTLQQEVWKFNILAPQKLTWRRTFYTFEMEVLLFFFSSDKKDFHLV